MDFPEIGHFYQFSKKIILGVLERLENSKNTRKIDGIELQNGFSFFRDRILTRNDF